MDKTQKTTKPRKYYGRAKSRMPAKASTAPKADYFPRKTSLASAASAVGRSIMKMVMHPLGGNDINNILKK